MMNLAAIVLMMSAIGIDLDKLKEDARNREPGVVSGEVGELEIIYRLWCGDFRPVGDPLPFDYNRDGLINYIDFAEYAKKHESHKSSEYIYLVQIIDYIMRE